MKAFFRINAILDLKSIRQLNSLLPEEEILTLNALKGFGDTVTILMSADPEGNLKFETLECIPVTQSNQEAVDE